MRIDDLEIFSDVVRYHSMNIAAEKHFMTPQNLSKIIKNMEKELDVTLFQRSKKGSELTDEGELFYIKISEILSEYHDAVREIKKNVQVIPKEENEETVRILCHQGTVYYAVMNAYTLLKQDENRKIPLEIETEKFKKNDTFIDFVKQGDYDIIVLMTNESGISDIIDSCKNYIPMFILQDEYALMVPQVHPLADREIVSRAELENLDLILVKDGFGYKDVISAGMQIVMTMDLMSNVIEQIECSTDLCTISCRNILRLNAMMKKRECQFAIIPIKEKFYATFIVLMNKKANGKKNVRTFAKKIGAVLSQNSGY